VAKSEAGKGFGLHRSLDQLGAVLGPLFAFAAIPFIGIRGVFWVSFIPAALGLLILVFFVKDTRGKVRQGTAFQNVRTVLNREFIFLLVFLGIFAIGAYNFSFILLEAGSLGIQENDAPLVVLFGSYLAISETVQRALIPDFTRPELKGTAYAVYYTLIGICSLVANSIFGFLWTNSGAAVAFQYSAVTSASGMIALVIFIAAKRK